MSSRIKWNRCRKVEPDGGRCPVITWGQTYCSFHQPLKGRWRVESVETREEVAARLDLAMTTVKAVNALTSEGVGFPSLFLDRVIGLETRPALTNDYKARVILDSYNRQVSPELQVQVAHKMAELLELAKPKEEVVA